MWLILGFVEGLKSQLYLTSYRGAIDSQKNDMSKTTEKNVIWGMPGYSVNILNTRVDRQKDSLYVDVRLMDRVSATEGTSMFTQNKTTVTY